MGDDGRPSPVFEEDPGFRFLIKLVTESLGTLHGKLASIVFPHVAAEDLGFVPVSVQQNFVKALFFDLHVSYQQWQPLMSTYHNEIAASKHSYVLFVLYACEIVYESIEHPVYERLLDVFGLVAAFSLAFSVEHDYHQYAPAILAIFFQDRIRIDFHLYGGWEGFEGYLKGLFYINWYYLKEDLRFRDVSRPFKKQTAWWMEGKGYHHQVRFISPSEVYSDTRCSELLNRVMIYDTTEWDVLNDHTLETVLANQGVSRVRGALVYKRRVKKYYEDVGDSEERKQLGLEELENEVQRLEETYKQAGYELSMVNEAKALFEQVKGQLNEAKRVSETLRQLYYPPS